MVTLRRVRQAGLFRAMHVVVEGVRQTCLASAQTCCSLIEGLLLRNSAHPIAVHDTVRAPSATPKASPMAATPNYQDVARKLATAKIEADSCA